MVRGDVSIEKRQAAVDAFQNDPNVTVFLGQIQAAGVGLTLTASSHVIFAELDWVPGNVSQAEDRCHRIGQKDAVLVQHLVFDGSIDANMAHKLVAKQAVIDAALDNERAVIAAQEPFIAPTRDSAASEGVSRDKLAVRGAQMTPEQIALVHEGVQILASYDDDRARYENGIGYSKIDVGVGHDLARRPFLTPRAAALAAILCAKYRRQLPAHIVEAAKENKKVEAAA